MNSTRHRSNMLQEVRDVTLVVVILGAPFWLATPSAQISDQYVPVGAVQSIRFFENFGVQTQIDTRDEMGSERNFVVNRVSDLKKGQTVVLHVRMFQTELCSADRSTCEELLGSPK